MPKEILLYGDIDNFSAARFITEMNEVNENEELSVRVNTEGGDPVSGWGIAAKYSEFPGKKSVKVDGSAHSSGLFFVAQAKDVEALSVSSFVLHRAHYPDWFEESSLFTEGVKANLEIVNKGLRKAIETKIDVKKLEELKGVKMNDIFSMDGRLDVVLTAPEAKKIGLINKVTQINKQIRAEIVENIKMVAKHIPQSNIDLPEEEIIEKPKKKIIMTLEELRAAYPALAAQLVAEGETTGHAAGARAEKDRTGAWLAWNHINPKAVAEGIKSKDAPSLTDVGGFQAMAVAPEMQAKLAAEAAKIVETKKPDDKEKTEVEQTEEKMMASLGLPETK